MDAAALRRALVRAADPRLDGCPTIDLRALDPLVALAAGAAFAIEDAAVLHGSPHDVPGGRLAPRPAVDAAKASGNRHAVYATAVPSLAVWYATLDRRRIREAVGPFRFGYRVEHGTIRPWVSPNAVRLVAAPDAGGFTSGFVYVLDGTGFSASDPAGVELRSDRPVPARWVLSVPASCGWVVRSSADRAGGAPAAGAEGQPASSPAISSSW